jgi:hypothetical protein
MAAKFPLNACSVQKLFSDKPAFRARLDLTVRRELSWSDNTPCSDPAQEVCLDWRCIDVKSIDMLPSGNVTVTLSVTMYRATYHEIHEISFASMRPAVVRSTVIQLGIFN